MLTEREIATLVLVAALLAFGLTKRDVRKVVWR
jgi:hypothetical protein